MKLNSAPAQKPKAKPAAPLKTRNQKTPEAKKKRKKEASDDGPAKKKVKDAETKWETLHHCGVVFPPDYVPHGVKMLYDGRPVDLTPEQEEVSGDGHDDSSLSSDLDSLPGCTSTL